MQLVFPIISLLIFGAAASAAPAPTLNALVHDGLESLPEDALRYISSRLPAVDRFSFSFASSYLRKVLVLNDADIVSARLIRRFNETDCLVAALHIENAPPGLILEVVFKLLRSTNFGDVALRKALKHAYSVGHCDIVDVLSNHLPTSPLDDDNAQDVVSDRASCSNVAQLASLPLAKLLRMHALPQTKFLQVLASKYSGSGYKSLFKNSAWYSKSCSTTVMSHALHVYNKLNGSVDFEPIPFGLISSTSTMPEQTQMTLLHMSSSLCTDPQRVFGSCDRCRYAFSHLQLVLSPGSTIEFFKSTSLEFRTEFLMEACKTGRLDWVKFMVNHALWKDVYVSNVDFCILGFGWHLFHHNIVRFADVLAADDPVTAAFEMVFHHQMNRLSSNFQRIERCEGLLFFLRGAAKKIVTAYLNSDSTRRLNSHQENNFLDIGRLM